MNVFAFWNITYDTHMYTTQTLIQQAEAVDRELTFLDGLALVSADPMSGVLQMLGRCSLITLHGILQRQRQDVRRYRITLTALRGTEVPHLFTDIAVHIQITGQALQSSKCAQAVHLFAKYCPVHHHLSAHARIQHTWEIEGASS